MLNDSHPPDHKLPVVVPATMRNKEIIIIIVSQLSQTAETVNQSETQFKRICGCCEYFPVLVFVLILVLIVLLVWFYVIGLKNFS